MKQILTYFLIGSLFCVAKSTSAQTCAVDSTNFNNSNGLLLWPDPVAFSSTNYNACIGEDYSATFQLKTITDTSASGLAVKILAVKIIGVTGLPQGAVVIPNLSDSTWVNGGVFPNLIPTFGCFTIQIPGSSLIAQTNYNFTIELDLLMNIAGQESWYSALPAPIGTGTYVSISGYTLNVTTNNCSNQDVSTVSGKVFNDLNANGIMDGNDTPTPNKFISFNPSTFFSVSASNGNYSITILSNSYELSVSNLPLYHISVPSSIVVDATIPNAVYPNNDFAIQAIPNITDISVTGDIVGWWAPGFYFNYMVTVCNQGTTVADGTVNLIYDSNRLQYNSAIPNPSGIQANNLAWSYTNLAPGNCQTFNIYFRNDSLTELGSILNFTSTASTLLPDSIPSDNTFIDSILVVGAYDPNDKSVEPAGNLSPLQISNGQWLNYRIRFQNTGTAQAFNIKVRDTLSTNLDWSTFKVLSNSHSMTYTLDDLGQVVFYFDNIMLPDSNTNEPESHGFIKYKIKAKNNLQIGDSIKNTAYIYFDFNLPVITNTIVSEVQVPNSVQNLELDNQLLINLYPNPATERINYTIESTSKSSVKFEIFDLLGNLILRHTTTSDKGIINLPGIKGLYFLRFEQDGKQKTSKIIVE
jgi:uncharacterized repeat protein (TIGR01451 family)